MECRRSLAMRILSIEPRLSDKRVNCDKMEEKLVQIFIPHERTFSLYSFLRKRMVGGTVGETLFYLKFWVNHPPLERNRRF